VGTNGVALHHLLLEGTLQMFPLLPLRLVLLQKLHLHKVSILLQIVFLPLQLSLLSIL
jgi:hypothetical protein